MKQLTAFIFLCFAFTACIGQQVSTPYAENFVNIDKKIFELLSNGELKVFDATRNIQVYKGLKTDFRISFLGKDNQGKLVVSTEIGTLMRLNEKTLSWENITPTHFKKCFGFEFDSSGGCFELVVDGICDTKTGNVFTPGKELSFSEHRFRGGPFNDWDRQEGIKYFIDKNDNFWFTASYGEWGSDIFVFNTIAHRFVKPQGDLMKLVRDVFESDKNVYCYGSGVRNKPFVEFGFYSRIDTVHNDTSTYKLTSHTIYSTLDNKGHDQLMSPKKSVHPDDYIGPAAFNPFDKNIYFYCAYGLYKGDPSKQLTDISHWTKVKNFKLQFHNTQPSTQKKIKLTGDSIPIIDVLVDYSSDPLSEMSKMEFTKEGKLVFISRHVGLGIFDGQKITILDSGGSR